MAACTIFEEDEVSISTDKGFRCGLVLESSEYVSSDEEEEDPPFFERVRKGTIRVAWHPEGDEEVIQESKVQLADRSLMPGDVVRRLIEGQDSQRGYVIHTNVKTYIQQLGKNKIICDVNSRDLTPLETWNTDPGTVYLDSWTGRIERIVDSITVRFPDGARCEVSDDDFFTQLANFEDLAEKRERDSEFCTGNYYAGQQLKGDIGNLVSAKWLKTTKAHSPAEAKKYEGKEVVLTVEKVEAKSIEVHWVCRGYSKVDDPSNRLEPPSRFLNGEQIKRLKKLDCFEPCSVQIGDKAFYTIKSNDKVLTVSSKGKKSSLHHLLKGDGDANTIVHNITETDMNAKNVAADASSDVNPTGAESSVLVNGEMSEGKDENPSDNTKDAPETPRDADDEWEDEESCDSDAGSTSSAHSSSSLKKAKKGGIVKTKLLKTKKLKRTRRKSGSGSNPQPGETIPVEIIYSMSSIDVMWQDGTTEDNIPSTDLFPIHHLDELEFFPGDFVVPADSTSDSTYGVVKSVDHAERTCQVKWMKPYVVGESTRPTENIIPEELSVYDIKDHSDYKFRPGQAVVRVGGYEEQQQQQGPGKDQAAGQVYTLSCDGRLLIQWPDGSQSMCYPQELYLIDDVLSELNDSEFDSDSDSDSDSMGDSDSNASWETENEESVDEDEEGNDRESDEELTVDAEKKVELDQLLDTAKSTLKSLEDTFAQNVDIGTCAIQCYKEILHINKNCRDLDKMLNTSYFEEENLTEVVSTIRKQLKHEKTAKLTKAVMELFESNIKPSPCVSSSANTSHGDTTSACSETDSGLGKSPNGVESGDQKPTSSLSAAEFIDKAVLVAGGVMKSESPPVALQQELAKLDDQFKQLQVQGILGGIPDLSDASSSSSKETKPNCDTAKKPPEVTAVSSKETVAEALSGLVEDTRAKDLCKRACHLLREQIIRVHKDLEKKWQKLKDSGKLHVVGEDETSSEASDSDEAAIPEQVARTPEAVASPDAKLAELISDQGVAGAGAGDATPRAKLDLNLKKEEETIEALLQQTPMTPQTPAEVRAKLEFNENGFEVIDSVSETHKFSKAEHAPSDRKAYMSAIRKEMKLLRTSLPKGIFVKGFEDRMDLFTVMIEGPSHTPYEDGLFFFEVQLPNDYPTTPPVFHYVSFCSDRLNPNLYEDGKVCVSLLGTWTGRGTEVWTGKSSLLQVLISIQGLILVSEPYYNEAGYEKQKGTQQGTENSRMYNEMAILKLVQSMTQMCLNPPLAFKSEVNEHMELKADRMVQRLQYWLDHTASTCMNGASSAHEPDMKAAMDFSLPDFPLLPVSRGFCLTLQKNLDKFKSVLDKVKSAL